jgi:hypothetical protein
MIYNKYLSFDLSLHNTLFRFNSLTSEDEVSIKKLLNLLTSNWLKEGYSSFDEEMHYKLKAILSLTKYYKNPLDIGYENILINKFLSTVNPKGSLLTCKIDKFHELPNNMLEIIDYKSGSSIPSTNYLFSCYSFYKTLYIVNKKLDIYPDSFSYYYLLYNKKYSIKISKEIIKNLKLYFPN